MASKLVKINLLAFAASALILSSCVQDKCTSTRTYIEYTPVYKSMAEISEMVEVQGPQKLETPGKLWLRDQYLFVNEYGKGIHIYDCSDRQNPTSINFLNIPGNVDMAVKNNTLYADQFVDLVVFDISDLTNIHEVNRIPNAFPENFSVHKQANRWAVDTEKGIAFDWTETVTEVDCDQFNNWDDNVFIRTDGNVAMESTTDGGNSNNQSSNSQGGSMARFTIMNNHLYTIDNDEMFLYNIENNIAPVKGETVQMPWGIETIFPYYRGEDPYIFIGSTRGMYIYDNSNPAAPFQVGEMSHIESCDPVVAKENHAYVTLRSGNRCGGFTDQLEIADITDLTNPMRTQIHSMTNPWGLGVDNDLLFICDGRDGLKVYDLKDDPSPEKLKLVEHFKKYSTYDVIPFDGTLYLIADDGFHLFDYSDRDKIKELGHIAIEIEN
ncbi:MAG: hypothetical protein KDC92_01860 [Bacteroidetes bacterium]|nr:hypothetical protein [Bacteroidota bacterium]